MPCLVIEIWVAREPSCIEVRGTSAQIGDINEVFAMRARSFWIVIFAQLTALEMLAHDGAPLSLEIYVYNQAQVPKRILSRAEQRVTVILRDSGVEPEWRECSVSEGGRDCSGPATPGSVAMQIVHRTTKMSDEIFGAAFLGEDGIGRQTDVFYDRLTELHRDWNVALPELLGNVMAHELGHLLLGFHAHSVAGIMQPVWATKELELVERGALVFTAEQSRLIRQRLERFAMAASAGAASGN